MTETTTATTPAASTPASEGIATSPTYIGSPPVTPQPVTIVETKKPTWDEELGAVYDKAQIDSPESWTDSAEVEALREASTPSENAPKAPDTPGDKSTAQQPLAAPHSWSAEMKAQWGKYSPAEQTYFAEREKEAHTKITQQGNELRQFQPVREIYDWIRNQGVPSGREPEVIANWARAQAALDANPKEGLKWLANSYKVDLAELARETAQTGQGSEYDDVFHDPRLEKISSEVAQLRAQNAHLYRTMTAREQAEQSARERQLEDMIETFSKGVPDWDAIEPHMAHEIAAVRDLEPNISHEQLLQKATERARWANPTTRARMLEEEKRQRDEEAAKKAAQAKKVASMNMRTGASASTPAFDGKWDDKANLGALYDRIQSGSK